jgi:hypothetical protein
MQPMWRVSAWVIVGSGMLLVACGSASPGTRESGEGEAAGTGGAAPVRERDGEAPRTSDGGTPPESDRAQTPPREDTELEAWLAAGTYRQWSCETDVHASRSPSPHGFNRICSNDAIRRNATAAGDWPVGAAAVKELYSSATAGAPFGYSVYLKTAADSAGGDNWYWYERLPPKSLFSGLGVGACTGCHSSAGRSASSTPSPGSRDFVFTPVR